ncbi:MAG: ABC transporter permease [Gemmatimonadaceae bacterium]|nr:ABC transporter permease [Gemmatimonadaceae bacterium]
MQILPQNFAPLAKLAWRESRSARRRLLLYMSSISLGAAALVAIDSYASNVTASVQEQSRALLGGDIALSTRRPLFDSTQKLLDTLTRQGVRFARVTSFPSMALVPRTTAIRLVQVRAVSSNYPVYGEITTEPAGQWQQLQAGPHALVDPSLLVTLEAHIGDTLKLGFGQFVITGTLKDVPGSSEISEIFGPRVFIPERYVAETRLLVFGSTAQYRFLGKVPASIKPDALVKPMRKLFAQVGMEARTAEQSEAQATRAILQLRNFIGVVGLVALLLGGIGVASGVRAFVARKIDTVAILRCLGASSGQVLSIYVAQAAAMGLLGAAAGAALGVAVQFALPRVMRDFLPVDVTVSLVPTAIIAGIAVGGWIALIFSLRPLLGVRNISPLQTLRRESDADILRTRFRDVPRLLVDAALVLSVVLIALSRSTRVSNGLGMAAATGAVILMLVLSATALAYAARKSLRKGWPYVIRQGVANLYRPANQTRAVILALGFGSFLITTLYVVQANLLRQFSSDSAASRANVVFYDVQPDQEADIQKTVRSGGHEVVQTAPVVTMRIAQINGVSVSTMVADTTLKPRRQNWTLRREYRSTFRDSVAEGETITKGKWFGAQKLSRDTGEVSLENSLATDLKANVGDVITWDVQGVMLPTRVTSLRDVIWTRFEPNFFAVFSPESLREAPRQYVVLANVSGRAEVTRLQRALVGKYPNISSLDLSLIKESIMKVMSKVAIAVRFMAIFSLAMGIPVLFSSIAATRRDRIREGVLLKTLGATRGQIMRILLSEYILLGVLGSLTGMVLAIGGGWALTHFVFENDFSPAWGPAFGIAGLMMALTVSIGLLAGRDVFRETAMSALRES